MQHACTRVRAYTEKRERERIYTRVYIRADWQSERALKARRFHVQLAFLIGGAIDATRKGKLCFEGGEGEKVRVSVLPRLKNPTFPVTDK